MFRCVGRAAVIALRPLHRHEGRLPLDGLRDARRGAEPHLHRAAALHRHRSRARAPPGQPRARSASPRAYGFYLVVGTPLFMGRQLYSDALGLAILQQANRFFELDAVDGAVAAARRARRSAVALLALRAHASADASPALGRRPRRRHPRLERHRRDRGGRRQRLGQPRRSRRRCRIRSRGSTTSRTGSRRSTSAQGVADQNPNGCSSSGTARSSTVSSLDGDPRRARARAAPELTPTASSTGRSTRTLRAGVYDYAVEDWPCVDFAGTFAASHFYRGGADAPKQWRLIQLTKPNRLRGECTGIYADGWSGPNDSTYFRFAASAGWLRIRSAPENWPSTPVDVQLASISDGHQQPVLGQVA